MSELTIERLVAETPEARPLWEALAAGRLELQRCGECRRLRFPPLPSCPYCSAPGGDWEPVEPRGTLYSWVVTHVAFDPAFADAVPYTVATVELDGGPRMFARLTGVEGDDLRAGIPLEGYFHPEGALPFLRFRPAADGA